MKFATILVAFIAQFHALNCQALDENGVSLYEKEEEMERLLVPGVGVKNGLESSVNPCGFFQTGNPNEGHQTAAEWLRLVFHDAVTADVAAGTGGLDASISFERLRPENNGVSFVNSTLGIFNNFFTVYTSMSDIIGLGLAATLISCDPHPRLLKLRVGRMDAHQAGPPGVPEPSTDIITTLAHFSRAGFNKSEAIASVACGHSIGSVNNEDFKDIIPFSVRAPNNLHGNVSFDTTKDSFDNAVIHEYLNGTGNKGGPLVIGLNQTFNSDLRLYTSDGNATIRTLTNAQAYADRCYTLFEKMMDTVPRGTVLSNPIVPRPWSMFSSQLDLTATGQLNFSGQIQALSKPFTAPPPLTANYHYVAAGSSNTGPQSVAKEDDSPFVMRAYGTISRYAFSDILRSPTVEGIKAGGTFENPVYSMPINTKVFVSPSRTFIKSGFGTAGALVVRVAVLSTLPTAPVVATLYYGTAQVGSIVPRISRKTVTLAFQETVGAYKIYKGVANLGVNEPASRTHIDVKVGTGATAIVSKKVSSSIIQQCNWPSINQC